MEPDQTTNAFVEIRLLGGFSVRCDGHALDDRAWRGRKAQSLVKLLAVEPSHRLHREQIADRLWPDLDAEAADRQLHKAIHAARRALEPALESGAESRYITTRDRMVALEASPTLRVDADAFEVAAEAALAADDVAAAEAAVASYAGDLLPEDLYDDGLEARRSRLRTLFLRVAARLAERYAAAARFDEAIETAARLLVVEPTNERAHRCLMSVYARVGERHRALQQYRDCARLLADELDAEPSPETVALHASLLAAPPAVDERKTPSVEAAPVATPPPAAARTPRRWWPTAVACAAAMLAVLAYPLSQAAEVRDFAGAISRSVDRALAPDGGLVAISGRLGTKGRRVEALDSASGWAGSSDADGRFVVPDVAWRPGATYRLLVTVDMGPAAIYTVRAPDARPESGVVDVGSLAPIDGRPVDPDGLGGANTWSRIAYDEANGTWYEAVFWTVTAAQTTNASKLAALNEFVTVRFAAPTGSALPRTPRETLERGSRYSGPLVVAFATLAHAGGYDVRIVDIIGDGEGVVHSVVEVFYEGRWHAYDPAFGVSATNEYGWVVSHVELHLNADLVSRMGYDRAVRPGWRGDAIPGLYRSGAHHFTVFDE